MQTKAAILDNAKEQQLEEPSYVHDSTVDVTKLLETEKSCAMAAIVKDVAGGGVYRDSS